MRSLPPCLQRWHHSSVVPSVIQIRMTEAGSGTFVGPWRSLHVRGRGPAPPMRALAETQVSQCSWGLTPCSQSVNQVWGGSGQADDREALATPPQH